MYSKNASKDLYSHFIHLFYVVEQNTPNTSKPSGEAPIWESHLYLSLFPRGLKVTRRVHSWKTRPQGFRELWGLLLSNTKLIITQSPYSRFSTHEKVQQGMTRKFSLCVFCELVQLLKTWLPCMSILSIQRSNLSVFLYILL